MVVSVRGPMEADPPRGAVPRVVGYPVAQKTIVVLEADARGLEALTEPARTLTTYWPGSKGLHSTSYFDFAQNRVVWRSDWQHSSTGHDRRQTQCF